VAAADDCGQLIADRELGLGALTGVEVDRSAAAAMRVRTQPGSTALLSTSASAVLGRRRAPPPGAWSRRWPVPCPSAAPSSRGLQASPAAAMKLAAEIDQSARALEQARQDVRRERVDRQHGGVALRFRAAAWLAVDARIVDDGVHAPNWVNLVRNAPGLGRAAQIADRQPSACGAASASPSARARERRGQPPHALGP
jgi:hypothetical protein